jgi:hypothetical protein
MTVAEPTMVGLSVETHARLQRLKEDDHFLEMVDAYRCGVALALAQGVIPNEVPTPRTTVFSVATFDPDGQIAMAIRAIMDIKDMQVYRMAERLAEWGVEDLARQAENGEINFGALLTQVEKLKSPG